VIGEAEVAELECEAYELGEEVGGVETAVYKNGPVDVGV
jgi:hypothetical protein